MKSIQRFFDRHFYISSNDFYFSFVGVLELVLVLEVVGTSEEADRAFVQRALRIGIVTLIFLAVLGTALWILKGAFTPLAVAFLLR